MSSCVKHAGVKSQFLRSAMIQVSGDLLTCKEQVIVQQCNCCSVRPQGLSRDVAHRFPYANCYGRRKTMGQRNHCVKGHRGRPGSILVDFPSTAGDDGDAKQKIVVHLFAQYYMGKPGQWGRYYSTSDDPEVPDTKALRLTWFQLCLVQLADWMRTQRRTSVAIPHMLGCGMAGGDWKTYSTLLNDWATKNAFTVHCYKLQEST